MSTPITLFDFFVSPKSFVRNPITGLYHAGMKLLRALFTLLFPERPSETIVADLTPESLGTLAEPTQGERNIVSLLPYRAPLVRACIREAKFHANPKAWTLLGSILADYVRELESDWNTFEDHQIILVPIPLSRRRMKDRGYNQVERIAESARTSYAHLRIKNTLLVRVRDTLPQTGLRGHARRLNLKGAFEVHGALNSTHTYIVLDDVTTTGTTLATACRTLVSSGAIRVLGLSLAH